MGVGGIVLREGGADPGGDDALLGFAGIGKRIAHEMHAAALPCGAEHLGNGGFQPFMRIGDDQLDAPQATPGQAAQQLCPERLGLAVAGGHAEHLAPAIGVHAHSDDDGGGDDAVVAPDLDVGGVEPDLGPVALYGPGEEGANTLIDLAAQARDLALGNAFAAHGLDQIINRTC